MRQVTPEDAPELARLLQACGLDDNPNEARIARVILNTTRITLGEQGRDGGLIGFVDAFMTASPDGVARWEVDLLGVHPNHRGKGIAQRLIGAVVAAGAQAGAQLFRAIVKTDNVASLTAFQHCGFANDETIHDLYVSDQPIAQADDLPPDAYLISVCTLTYSGIWIEGDHSLSALRYAQAVRTRYGWDVAGALAPAESAMPDGFALAGQYLHLRRKILTKQSVG
ncbi:MAG: GNAT family N-acetyltransferase [Chloroflexota bacterium]